MNKKIFGITFLLIFLATLYLLLGYSGKVNNFVFKEIINPYNPLNSNKPKLAGVQGNNNEYWNDPRGLFPIFAYNLPDKSNDLIASLKIIEEGGINIIVNGNYSWMPSPYKVREAFEQLGESKLKWLAIIENECKDNFIYRNSNDDTNSDIKKYLSEFNDDFVYGWYVWDEPGNNRKLCTPLNLAPNDDNEDINRMSKQIRSDTTFNRKLDYMNLFPSYWDLTPDESSYEQYIDTFINSQEFKPRILCFDHYPLLKEKFGGFRKDYYSNLKIIRKKSIEHNIPFWMIVLSSGHDDYGNPSFEDISFQVYSALAYGAKGIGYYLYSKSWEKASYSSWILENYVDEPDVADSLHGPLFLPVKRLNGNLQNLGKILMKLKSVKVLHTSDYPNNQNGISSLIFNEKEINGPMKNIKLAG
ncbi:MAG: hypothetical protein P8X73_02775, partial [Ignavibacteriaceae bacterium]